MNCADSHEKWINRRFADALHVLCDWLLGACVTFRCSCSRVNHKLWVDRECLYWALWAWCTFFLGYEWYKHWQPIKTLPTLKCALQLWINNIIICWCGCYYSYFSYCSGCEQVSTKKRHTTGETLTNACAFRETKRHYFKQQTSPEALAEQRNYSLVIMSLHSSCSPSPQRVTL